MISFISSLEFINVVILDPSIFSWVAASVAAAAVNPNMIKTRLASGSDLFYIKNNPVFSNGQKGLLKIHPDCPILCNWVFDNSILVDELFAKSVETLQTCL